MYMHIFFFMADNMQVDEILSFATTHMDLEGIILNEVSQVKTDTIWFHLYVESKSKTYKQT